VGIGGALAEARTEAGLTVTQVSERTRIRETLIRDIERDDYSACGGDYYARGHIRAIARVVGTDPVPLIEEYDAAHMPPEPDEADGTDTHGWRIPGLHRLAYSDPGANGLAGSSGPDCGLNGTAHAGNGVARNSVARNHYGSTSVPADTHVDTSADADTGTELYNAGTLASGGTGASRSAGVLDSAARWAESARSRLARPPEPAGSGVPGGITAAEAFRPSMPLEPRRRRRGGTRALALFVVAAIGTLVYLLAVGGSSPAPRNAATHHPAGSTSAKHPSTKTTAPAAAAGPLSVVGATAFGPGGAAHGDNPQEASFVLNGSDTAGWQTDWYGTADFAGLQSGTGLLLDLGNPATVTSARILLGPAAGGAIELRAGNSPSLRRLHVVAQAANSGGTLSVPISSPVAARYLLIWFTSLPPDASGTYQATVYQVHLLGTS
jgi:transcriptional regulator with XRE-family HTH domain